MSLDTKYRPLKFSDVIGQQGTIQVLKNLVKTGKVFQKSYVFAGPSGTGKTTTARILARAMLCDNVTPEGEPCNQCESCREIIEGTSSFNFVEMDAANNSGVQTIRQIVESADYYTLGGKERRIYLIDEAHRLTKEAMDALLKPMEDNIPGTEDKRLVCLLCTTEPEKLRGTIKARCMMFGIREPERQDVVKRLAHISDLEGFEYEEDALDMIFAHGRGHIRDMVNALERVSRVGAITVANTREQLGLTAVTNYYRILDLLGTNLQGALKLARETLHITGPGTLYTGLAESCLASYRTSLGIDEGIPTVDISLAKDVFKRHGESLLPVADRILRSNYRMDETLLICELVLIHRYFAHGIFFPETQVPDLESMPKVAAGQPPIPEEPQEPDASDEVEDNADLQYAADPDYADVYGSQGRHFMNRQGRVRNRDDEPEEKPERPREGLRPVTTAKFRNTWSALFDE